jgi:general secretion pathway protein F
MLFAVRVADGASKVSTVHVEAADAADARQRVQRLRLAILSVEAAVRGGGASAPAFDLTLFAEELQILLAAGLSMVEALEGLAAREQAAGSASILESLIEQLRNGEQLSAAMAMHPQAFPPLFVGIVRAAEATSSVPAALSKYIAYEAHLRSVRERIVAAAIYPSLLLALGTGVTLFLMMYVVPRFAAVYQASGRPLPWASTLLFEAGRLMGAHWWVIVAALALGALALWQRLRSAAGSNPWLAVLAFVPSGRSAVRTIELSRLYRTLAMLLEGGLPLTEALQLARSVAAAERAAALERTRGLVLGGEPLSAALGASGLATALALRLVRVGERSGSLGTMLERAAAFHEHETAVWIDRFSRLFAPALMIAVSVVVGAIVLFLYVPIFDLAASFR